MSIDITWTEEDAHYYEQMLQNQAHYEVYDSLSALIKWYKYLISSNQATEHFEPELVARCEKKIALIQKYLTAAEWAYELDKHPEGRSS